MDSGSFGVMLSEPDTILVAERRDVSDWGALPVRIIVSPQRSGRTRSSVCDPRLSGHSGWLSPDVTRSLPQNVMRR
jgi:hypothetical protein